MTKYRTSKVTVRLPDYVVKELDEHAKNENMSRNELIRKLFEIDFGDKEKETIQNKNKLNNIRVSFLVPENVASYIRNRASNLGIGYTTYARHYLEKKLGRDFT